MASARKSKQTLKKILFLLSAFLSCFFANAQHGSFTIEGDISPLKNQLGVSADSLSMILYEGYDEDQPVEFQYLRFHFSGTLDSPYATMANLFLKNDVDGELLLVIPIIKEEGHIRVWCRELPGDDLYQVEVTGTPLNDAMTQRIGDYMNVNFEMLDLSRDTTLTYEEISPIVEGLLAKQDSLMRFWYRDSRETELAPMLAIQDFNGTNRYREGTAELAYLEKVFPGHPALRDLETVLGMMPGLEAGDSLPRLVLHDQNGAPVDLSELNREQYLLIDFWSSVSGQSMADFPALKKLPSQYLGKPLTIVSISTDLSRNVWVESLKKYKPAGIQLWDERLEASKALHLSTYPVRFLIDPEGVVIRKGNFTELAED